MSEDRERASGTGLRAAGVARTRAAILAAARERLIADGYHRLSLERVAVDASVTRVTIYRQFESKLGLLDAVAGDLARRADLVAGIRTAGDMADPAAACRAMVAELCRFWSTDPDLFRRLISLAAVDPEAHRVLSSREQWRYEQVAVFVRRLAAGGRLREGVDTDRAVAAIGAVTGFPACDEMATRLRCGLDQLDPLLVTLLAGVADLG
ncbi:TetR/AcrR family transcriptional regulator [Streptomyces winkii]|uniref:TetR/AcrR family transcriptional regulator n=1 Tax=Streptomyces winkii TaxID=3051178 RepID=UPI0028D025FD|nr:helix-turn-helix domain-containing protein [Streptomyces sp. DSM 40971]